ncbi:MAG: hypothetical protein ACTSYL_11235 [Candidatus Thorarchaeota archaeon]
MPTAVGGRTLDILSKKVQLTINDRQAIIRESLYQLVPLQRGHHRFFYRRVNRDKRSD